MLTAGFACREGCPSGVPAWARSRRSPHGGQSRPRFFNARGQESVTSAPWAGSWHAGRRRNGPRACGRVLGPVAQAEADGDPTLRAADAPGGPVLVEVVGAQPRAFE